MSNEETSKVVVYENGDILDIKKCREALLAYWKLNKAEKRAFERLFKEHGIEEKYSHLLQDKP